MALQAKIKMIPGRKAGITSVPVYSAPQKTSATFIVGAPVKLSSGNLVAVTTANDASSDMTYIHASSTSTVLGISLGKAVSGDTHALPVARFMEGVEFIGNLIHDTASSAKVSKVGSTVYFGQDKSSDTHWGWTLSGHGTSPATYVNGRITGLVDPASTVNGRVLVSIVKGGLLSAF